MLVLGLKLQAFELSPVVGPQRVGVGGSCNYEADPGNSMNKPGGFSSLRRQTSAPLPGPHKAKASITRARHVWGHGGALAYFLGACMAADVFDQFSLLCFLGSIQHDCLSEILIQ